MPADDYVRIAVVTGVHGLAGRLKILVLSDIRERFKVNASVYIKIKDRYKKFTIADYTDYKNKSGLLTLEGIGDRNAAREYKGLDICIEKSEAEKTRSLLDKNSYYYYDIIGCFVYYQGRLFGAVTDILEAGAGEILVISSDTGKQFMIPYVESMVDIGDIRNNKLYIHPVEGLFDI